MVDLPEALKPVRHTTLPGCPFWRSRCSVVSLPRVQKMFSGLGDESSVFAIRVSETFARWTCPARKHRDAKGSTRLKIKTFQVRVSLIRPTPNYCRSLARKNLALAVSNKLLNVTVPVMLESVERLLQSKRLVDYSMA